MGDKNEIRRDPDGKIRLALGAAGAKEKADRAKLRDAAESWEALGKAEQDEVIRALLRLVGAG